MVNATIDNNPVSVTLSGGQTYTPSSGSVQKVNVQKFPKTRLTINGGVLGFADEGVSTIDEITMILTDSDTLKAVDLFPTSGVIHISGFEVN